MARSSAPRNQFQSSISWIDLVVVSHFNCVGNHCEQSRPKIFEIGLMPDSQVKQSGKDVRLRILNLLPVQKSFDQFLRTLLQVKSDCVQRRFVIDSNLSRSKIMSRLVNKCVAEIKRLFHRVLYPRALPALRRDSERVTNPRFRPASAR